MGGTYLAFPLLAVLHVAYVCVVYYTIFVRQAAPGPRGTLRRVHELMPCGASNCYPPGYHWIGDYCDTQGSWLILGAPSCCTDEYLLRGELICMPSEKMADM